MKLQSAIEFINTYSFMFLIIGAAIVVVAYIALATGSILPSHCAYFSGLVCNYMSFTYSSVTGTSNVLFSLTNSQSVPVNIIGFNVILTNATYSGLCTTTYMVPGNITTCYASIANLKPYRAQAEQGSYRLNAQYCNSAVGSISQSTCTWQPVTFGGSFYAYATPTS